jgi:hypothetical protein
MSFFTNIIETATGYIAKVSSAGRLKVDLETDAATNPAQVGGVRQFTENDAGDVIGTPFLLSPETSDDYRLRVGQDQTIFNLAFEGTNIARDRIQQNDTTATAAQANAFLTVNSGASTTSGQGCNIRTYRTFPMYGTYPIYVEFWAKEQNEDATNAFTEFGAGFCSGVTAQLTDGVFLRRMPGGQLRLVVTNNSTDIATADIDPTNIPPRDGVGAYTPTEVNHYIIVLHNDVVRCWINDVLVASIDNVATVPSPSQASALPIFARVYNSGTASAGRSISIGFVNVSMGDQNCNKLWAHVLTGMGGGAYQIQPGTASGPNVTRGAVAAAGWPNSAQARAAGTWTATTAPATASLGGQWVSPAISSLATEVDYPVFSFANPAGTATLPGKTLYITGVKWGKTVANAAASTNSINLNYIVAVGGTSSATTQTEAAAIVAARGTVLDTIPFKATAVIGDFVEGGNMDFAASPLVVPPGCFLVFAVRPFGTVTSNTLTLLGTVAFNGYFE